MVRTRLSLSAARTSRARSRSISSRSCESPSRVETQGDFLRAHGLDELVAEGRAAWDAGAATGGLEAIRGRSRIAEADALTDPNGLGGFSVVQWSER